MPRSKPDNREQKRTFNKSTDYEEYPDDLDSEYEDLDYEDSDWEYDDTDDEYSQYADEYGDVWDDNHYRRTKRDNYFDDYEPKEKRRRRLKQGLTNELDFNEEE